MINSNLSIVIAFWEDGGDQVMASNMESGSRFNFDWVDLRHSKDKEI